MEKQFKYAFITNHKHTSSHSNRYYNTHQMINTHLSKNASLKSLNY